MARDFDPYHRWLGIPPEEQPAHYYRLLGLSPFEDDLEVIRDAVERQSGHVRSYALGTHSDLSQEILNELGQAKACLLDETKKAAYDRELRNDIDAEPAVSAIPLPAVPPPFPSPPPPPPPEQVEYSDPGHRSVWSVPTFLAGAVLGFLLLAVVLLIASALFQGREKSGGGDGADRVEDKNATARPTTGNGGDAKPAKPGSHGKGSN